MRVRAYKWIVPAVLALFNSCSVNEPEQDASVEGPQISQAALTSAGDVSSAHSIARGVTLAMQSPHVRKVVRDAMRASEVTQHKLVLQDFMATAAGLEVLEAAASATRTPVADFRAALTKVPRLDFYVPPGSIGESGRPHLT